MNEDNFITIFDIETSGYKEWWYLAFGIIFVFLSLLIPRFISGSLRSKYIISILIFIFSMMWTVVNFYVTYDDYSNALRAIKSKTAGYVEGSIEDFHPLPVLAHGKESFSVKGIYFGYSDNIVTAGFNNTAAHGGPIENGIYVRIWYIVNKFKENEIVKLQIQNKSLRLPARA